MTEGELQAHWQSQPVAAPQVSIDYFLYRTREHERRSRSQNIRLLTVGAISGFFIFGIFLSMHTIAGRLVMASMLAINVYSMFQLRKAAQSATRLDDQDGQEALAFYRQQLERERDTRLRYWRFRTPVFIVVIMFLMIEPMEFPKWKEFIVPQIAFITIMSVYGYLKNRTKVAELQAELDALSAMR